MVLCFGLSTAPQVFSLVSTWVHIQGIWTLRHLNDWLVLADSWVKLIQQRETSPILSRLRHCDKFGKFKPLSKSKATLPRDGNRHDSSESLSFREMSVVGHSRFPVILREASP